LSPPSPPSSAPPRPLEYLPITSLSLLLRRATAPLNTNESRPYHNSSKGPRPLENIDSRPYSFGLLPLFPFLHNIFLAHDPIKQQFNFQYIIPRCVLPDLFDNRKPVEITFLFSLPF